jgi:hypothetical protein
MATRSETPTISIDDAARIVADELAPLGAILEELQRALGGDAMLKPTLRLIEGGDDG